MITKPWTTSTVNLLRRRNGGEPYVAGTGFLNEAVVQITDRAKRPYPDFPYRAYNSTAERCTAFRFGTTRTARFGEGNNWRDMIPWRIGPYQPLHSEGPFILLRDQHRLPIREMAMNEAIDLCRNTKVMLPAALAELPKTVSTFSNVFRRLWQLGKLQARLKRTLMVKVANRYRSARTGEILPLREHIDEVSKTAIGDHLAAKFAIVPSIEDLKALYELHSVPLAAGIWKTVSKRLYLYEDLETGLRHAEGDLVGRVSTHGRVKVSLFCHDPAAQYLQTMSLNGATVAANAWELIPLSFVVDAFLPVGDYLSRLGTNLDPFTVWWSSTETVWGDLRLVVNGKANTLGEICTDDPGTAVELQFKDRTEGSDTLVSSFLIRDEIKLAQGKLITYLELLRQQRALSGFR